MRALIRSRMPLEMPSEVRMQASGEWLSELAVGTDFRCLIVEYRLCLHD